MRYTFNPKERLGLILLTAIIIGIFTAIICLRRCTPPPPAESPSVIYRPATGEDSVADDITQSHTGKKKGKNKHSSRKGHRKRKKDSSAHRSPSDSRTSPRDFLRDTIPSRH